MKETPETAEAAAGAETDPGVRAAEAVGPPAGTRSRPIRRGLPAFALLLCFGAAAAWMLSLPSGISVTDVLREQGIPVPETAAGFFGGGSGEVSAPNGTQAMPPAADAAGEAGLPTIQVGPDGGIAPPLAPAIQPSQDRTPERLDLLEGLLAESAAAREGISGRIEDLAGGLAQLSETLDGIRDRLDAAESAAAEASEAAALARTEAHHGRSLAESAAGERNARLELVEVDIQALAAAHKTARAVIGAQSDRIEALAADLHLINRFGETARRTASPGPAETHAVAPWTSNYFPSSGAAAEAEEPAAAVQGQYRVGDWVAGWGAVSAIRRTPEGDHLTTPRGMLFAPPQDTE